MTTGGDVARWWNTVAARSWHGAEAALLLPAGARDLRVGPIPPGSALTGTLHTLAYGTQSSLPMRFVGGGAGHVPAMPTYLFAEPNGGASVEAIVRDGFEGQNEAAIYRASQLVSLDSLMAPAAARADGSTAMAVMAGSSFAEHGIVDGYGLEFALRVRRARALPTASEDEIARGARFDRQLIQSFDYVWGQYDRHPRNALRDAATGQVALIDSNLIFADNSLRSLDRTGPGVRQAAEGESLIPLLPEVQQVWQQLDHAAVRRAFRDVPDPFEGVSAADAVEAALQRADAIARDGYFVTAGDIAKTEQQSRVALSGP